MPAIPSWLLEPLWDQFAALLPGRPVYDPAHPLGCHKPRIADRIIFEKLIQVLRFGCSYASIADCTCGATTIRERGDEWIKAGIFGKLKQIARESYDRIVGLILEDLAVDGCITKAPGGGQCAGPSPVDRRKLGMKRSSMVEGRGIPLGRVLAPANRHDSPLLAPTLDKLDDLGPLPDDITVHLDAGYDSQKTRDELARRGMTGEIAQIQYTIPVEQYGLDPNGQAVLQNAVTEGATVTSVNIMVFDYYIAHEGVVEMGTAAENAATSTHTQLHSIFPSMTSAQIWNIEGMTMLPGIDDLKKKTEVTYEPDATTMLNFAQSNGMNFLSIWAIQRDNGGCPGTADSNTCSGITQNSWDFSHILEPFHS